MSPRQRLGCVRGAPPGAGLPEQAPNASVGHVTPPGGPEASLSHGPLPPLAMRAERMRWLGEGQGSGQACCIATERHRRVKLRDLGSNEREGVGFNGEAPVFAGQAPLRARGWRFNRRPAGPEARGSKRCRNRRTSGESRRPRAFAPIPGLRNRACGAHPRAGAPASSRAQSACSESRP